MKTKRVNSIIFVVSAIVFFLQVVGYFAPAWFVQEVAIKPESRGIHADGRRFELPHFQTEDLSGSGDDRDDSSDNGTEMSEESLIPEEDTLKGEDSIGDENSLPEKPGSRRKRNMPVITSHKNATGGHKGDTDKLTESTQKGGGNKQPTRPVRQPLPTKKPISENVNSKGDVWTRQPKFPVSQSLPTQIPEGRTTESKGEGNADPPTPFPGWRPVSIIATHPGGSNGGGNIHPTKPSVPIQPIPVIQKPGQDTGSLWPDKAAGTDNQAVKTNDTGTAHQVKPNWDKKKSRLNEILYITAGLWYSRACITTRNPNNDGIAGMQWCTLYTRFDDNTLERKKNMFELRLEATFGVVLSALSLLLSSTACCSHRHHGRRAVSSLAALFISGAVTAIPVVHIIIQHVQIHDKIVRQRKWMYLTKMMHVNHDLFDHYSVILCGVASLISVLSAFIFTIISCRSNSKPDNWYDMKHVQEEKESKHEFPINWVHNNKITVPQAAEIKEETKDDSESGYSDARDEGTVSVQDGGSVGNDCDRLEFDHKEMKTFDM